MLGARKRKRIYVTYPTHPLFLWVYLAVGLFMSLLVVRFPVIVASASYLPGRFALAALASALILLSPLLSFFNIAIATLRTGRLATIMEVKYVEFFGIPVPIPKLSLREVRTVLAINVGGALVPITSSVLLSYLMLNSPGARTYLYSVVVDLVATSLVTYFVARPVPGVGIAVPAFIPPLVAAFVSVISVGAFGVYAAAVAYVAGSLGSLVGADVLRLARSYKELSAGLLSIGGAGVFDGVFMSGIIAFLLAL